MRTDPPFPIAAAVLISLAIGFFFWWRDDPELTPGARVAADEQAEDDRSRAALDRAIAEQRKREQACEHIELDGTHAQLFKRLECEGIETITACDLSPHDVAVLERISGETFSRKGCTQ